MTFPATRESQDIRSKCGKQANAAREHHVQNVDDHDRRFIQALVNFWEGRPEEPLQLPIIESVRLRDCVIIAVLDYDDSCLRRRCSFCSGWRLETHASPEIHGAERITLEV